MNFAESKPIYRQIAERLEDEVLAGRYAEDERAPSVREYSALLQVNVNTVARAYEALAGEGVLVAQRGMGYYVSAGARESILSRRRAHFIEVEVPTFLHNMRRYGVSKEQLEAQLGDMQQTTELQTSSGKL